MIKDTSGDELVDGNALLAINKSPLHLNNEIQFKNEQMYQQIKNIYLPTSKIKQ